jgi:glycosyltransferase involved in cell wall biosynthesis
MRICFVSPNSIQTGGGAEEWILSVAQTLSRKHEVTIIGLRSPGSHRLSWESVDSRLGNADYLELPSIAFERGNPIPSPSSIRILQRAMIDSNVNYVVVPSPPLELVLYPFLRISGCPSIAGFHGQLRPDVLLQRSYIPIFELTLSSFKACHALNLATYHYLISRHVSSTYYFPNGIDTLEYQICRHPTESASFVVLFSGRLVEEKGVDSLLAVIVAANSRGNMNRLKFCIIGAGNQEEAVRRMAKRYENVEYLGFIPRDRLGETYRKANLFLIPSKSEGLPLRLIEAQCCGLPSVGFRIPGVDDLIIDGKSGLLVNRGDIEMFVDAIESFYMQWQRNPEDYYVMNMRIRESAIVKHDKALMIQRLEEMLKTVSHS